MQHAVGSPLPPHQPGQGPHAGWASAAHHPGAPQGPAPVPPPPPGYPGTGAGTGPVPPPGYPGGCHIPDTSVGPHPHGSRHAAT
ncbi:Pro-rich N-terminal domain-containing protein, partial [Streptomyces collinus]